MVRAFKGIALGSDAFIKKITEKIRSIGENREIGELFNMDYTSVSMMAKRFEKKTNTEISEMFKKVMKKWKEKADEYQM